MQVAIKVHTREAHDAFRTPTSHFSFIAFIAFNAFTAFIAFNAFTAPPTSKNIVKTLNLANKVNSLASKKNT